MNQIKFTDGGKHIYTYDASGRKLRAEHHVPVVVAAEPQIPIEDWLEPIEILEQSYEEPQIPGDAVVHLGKNGVVVEVRIGNRAEQSICQKRLHFFANGLPRLAKFVLNGSDSSHYAQQ